MHGEKKGSLLLRLYHATHSRCWAGYIQNAIYYILVVTFILKIYIMLQYYCVHRVMNYLLHYFVVTFN